jgi:hypothetical protein
MTDPVAARPAPTGYFTPAPIAWAWARHRLETARSYWVATVGPTGRPHTRPVWGVWIDDHFAFSTGSRIGTHLAANPAVTVHLESGAETVIVDGQASALADPAVLANVVAAYNAKYGWDYAADDPDGWWAVTPTVAFGWLCDPYGHDGGAIFNSTGTRWDFGE